MNFVQGTTSVAQCELVGHVVIDQIVVSVHLLSRAHVGGSKDFALGFDLDLVAGADPLVAVSQGELVNAIIQRDEHLRPNSDSTLAG